MVRSKRPTAIVNIYLEAIRSPGLLMQPNSAENPNIINNIK
uniref:Uncharacterized protein n=1 Tax=Arundo donax TaxID=35708 RepID=A0A0A9G3M2_ARUDO